MYVVRYNSIIRVGRTLLSIVGPFNCIAEATQWRDEFAGSCAIPLPASSIDLIVPPSALISKKD